MLFDLAEYLHRVVALLALSIAPRALSPEPAPVASETEALAWIAVAALGVVAALGFTVWARRAIDTPHARAAAALFGIALAAAFVTGFVYRGDRAPLARGAPVLAAFVWPALATMASALAGHFLGSNWKHKRMMGAIAVLGAGALQLANAAPYLASPEKMWRETLRRDLRHERALAEVARPLLQARKLEEAGKLVDRCRAARPPACACLELWADVALQKRATEEAIAAGRAAVQACPSRTRARELLAEALARAGMGAQPLDEAAKAGEVPRKAASPP